MRRNFDFQPTWEVPVVECISIDSHSTYVWVCFVLFCTTIKDSLRYIRPISAPIFPTVRLRSSAYCDSYRLSLRCVPPLIGKKMAAVKSFSFSPAIKTKWNISLKIWFNSIIFRLLLFSCISASSCWFVFFFLC